MREMQQSISLESQIQSLQLRNEELEGKVGPSFALLGRSLTFSPAHLCQQRSVAAPVAR